MIKFVLLSTQRSGTNFVEKWLNSHPEVRCHHELFLHKNHKEDSFYSYVNSHPLRWQCWKLYERCSRFTGSRILLKFLCRGFLKQFYTSPQYHKYYEKAVGFKLMYSDLRNFSGLDRLLVDEKIHIIHLIRKNKLRIILSLLVRKIRGRAHATVELPVVKITVDTATLFNELQTLQDREQATRQMFEKNPQIEITYEDFFRNHLETSERIEKFLGVTAGQWGWHNSKKLSPDSIEDIVINYTEVTQLLTGTKFEEYLKPEILAPEGNSKS